MSHVGHFDLDIPRALHAQLINTFSALEQATLSQLPDLDVPKQIGVYGLVLKDRLVYVGKATNLYSRLTKHAFKITGRQNISDSETGFVCLTVNPNWAAYAPENILIKYLKSQKLCGWNGSDFGSNDPGRKREETEKPPHGFDRQFPIRTEWPCDWLTAGRYPMLELLVSMKEHLPYTLRYQTPENTHWKKGHPDFDACIVELTADQMEVKGVVSLIAQALPGWQATAFPSHIILYKESRTYKHGEVL